MSKAKGPFYQDIDGFRIPGCFLAEAFTSGLAYKPVKEDLFIVTFPKCGTTWTQQIVCLIHTKGEPVENIGEFHNRTPFLEMAGPQAVDQMIRPGSIKVHLPFDLTPFSSDAKYLYIARNPKDALVSFYHHTRTPVYLYEDGGFNDYFEIFLNGENDFGDYFDHLLGWYEHRNDPNVLFLTYEELKRETPKTIKKIARFMGEEYGDLLENDEDTLKNVMKYSSVDFMKTIFNDSMAVTPVESGEDLDKIPPGILHVMKFMSENSNKDSKKFNLVRKGIVGDWRNNFTADQNRRMDEKIEAKLKGTDLYTYWKSIGCI